MRRRAFFTVAAVVALVPLVGRAQQKKMPVIGWLHSLSADRSAPVIAAFREGLRDTGYIDGENIQIEYRWGEGQYGRLPALAADLVAGKPDVIVAGGGTPPALAAKHATSTIPIVFASVGDPVEVGLVAGFARPGGNVTGISVMTVELMQKRFELLAELLPATDIVGLLVNPTIITTKRTIEAVREAAFMKGVQLQIVEASTEGDIERAFALLNEAQVRALVVAADPFFYDRRAQLAKLILAHALPAIFELRGLVDAGGLISYGTSLVGNYRQAGAYVGRILAGAKPAELPVQRPTKFELVINLKTAKALGLTVPQSLLARADEVIE